MGIIGPSMPKATVWTGDGKKLHIPNTKKEDSKLGGLWEKVSTKVALIQERRRV